MFKRLFGRLRKSVRFVAADILAVHLAAAASAAFRFDFALGSVPWIQVLGVGSALSLTLVVAGSATFLYSGRYVRGSVDEVIALAKTILIVGAVSGTGNLIFGLAWGIPRSLVFIALPIFALLAGGFRLGVRASKRRGEASADKTKIAVVFGAGRASEVLIPQLLGVDSSPYRPVALIDDDESKADRHISGVPTMGTWKDFERIVQSVGAEVVIVAIPSANSALLREVHEQSLALEIEMVVLPALDVYLSGPKTPDSMRLPSIEDLIGRQVVSLDSEGVHSLLQGNTVMVTGAGGSIGTELVKQIAQFMPSALVMVDRDETGLLDCSLEVERTNSNVRLEKYLVDIRDTDAVQALFAEKKPQVVFHAAALKHVSMLEDFPAEAWKTNVQGSLNLLEAAKQNEVSTFVNISTDKAANPVNVLGHSKKAAESLTAWFGATTRQQFVSVRFGNVLGSRGSLVPILSAQIAAGGPVTVTDERATRFFMSISEAAALVLQAPLHGEHGDVLVLDMGEPVSIKGVAEHLIRLSGNPIDIKYVGLRPGEKLHEELIATGEETLPSSHPKIIRLRTGLRDPAEVLAERW